MLRIHVSRMWRLVSASSKSCMCFLVGKAKRNTDHPEYPRVSGLRAANGLAVLALNRKPITESEVFGCW